MLKVTFDCESGLSVIVYPEHDRVVFVHPLDGYLSRGPIALTVDGALEAVKTVRRDRKLKEGRE